MPVGAFLSSGIDSSLIVSMMQKMSSKPIKTYTIGFDEDDFDESTKAKKISKFLKTEHSELFINKKILKETFLIWAKFGMNLLLISRKSLHI